MGRTMRGGGRGREGWWCLDVSSVFGLERKVIKLLQGHQSGRGNADAAGRWRRRSPRTTCHVTWLRAVLHNVSHHILYNVMLHYVLHLFNEELKS